VNRSRQRRDVLLGEIVLLFPALGRLDTKELLRKGAVAFEPQIVALVLAT